MTGHPADEPADAVGVGSPSESDGRPTGRITRLEVDGVPVFWMPEGRRPMATLQFRVGRSDEAFADMGLTHLVEHLAFFKIGRRDRANGFVDTIRTVFSIQGDSSDIAEFLAGIASAIHDLPLDRLADEARILRAEALRRTPSIFDQLAWLRYGAAGHGLAHLPELGLSRIGPAELTAWAAAWFTAGNASVWIAGPLPDGVRLPLPPGPRRPARTADPVPGLVLPAWTASRIPGIAMGTVVARRWAATIGTRILTKRLEQRLRYEMGRSYEVSLAYAPLDADVGHASIFASCLDADAGEVRRAFLALIDQFAHSRPTEEEMAEDRAGFAHYRDDPDSGYGELDRAVHDELLGVPHRSQEEDAADHARVTADEVRQAFARTVDGAILMGPLGDAPVGLSARRWNPYPDWSPAAITGRRFERTTKRFPWSKTTEALFVGPDGVTWFGEQRRPLTVRYADCVGMVIDTDGARIIHGRDGFRVIIRASEWRNGEAAVAAVDRAVPAGLVIRLPAT